LKLNMVRPAANRQTRVRHPLCHRQQTPAVLGDDLAIAVEAHPPHFPCLKQAVEL
jgi:hypothetical protein